MPSLAPLGIIFDKRKQIFSICPCIILYQRIIFISRKLSFGFIILTYFLKDYTLNSTALRVGVRGAEPCPAS
jgi:hypothetical protein